MLTTNVVVFTALAYVGVLFLLAYISDRRARRGDNWIRNSPVIYTLSISVYCTSWTFYGAVGSAARDGMDFATIYLGPTLVFLGWWYLLRKMVRIGHVHRISSIADLISSRYGKSNTLAVIVTMIAVIGTTPYIALQLKAVTTSFEVVSRASATAFLGIPQADLSFDAAFWVAFGMVVFTILFGSRNLDANEQHPGVVAAIAFEALVKLLALVVVGLFVVFSLGGGIGEVLNTEQAERLLSGDDMFDSRWVVLTFLSAVAIICLPRQFQVTVVENASENHLRTAGWLFPAYLFLTSLFILPIAIVGLEILPAGANPDMFVLTLPMAVRQDGLALLAFIGGFSSATSMVIVACIALSIMISNHIVIPIVLRLPVIGISPTGNMKQLVLNARRFSIVAVMGLGFLYYRVSAESEALASIGLIAFAGVAQFLPSMIAGLYWRRATARGVKLGLVAGFILWIFTLLLPSLAVEGSFAADIVRNGLFGLSYLRPHSLFGLEGYDPLVHAVIWSLSANILLVIVGSLFSEPSMLERLQCALFVDVFRDLGDTESRAVVRMATIDDLRVLSQRILGREAASRLFADFARQQGRHDGIPVVDPAFIAHLEREISGSVGAASARVMISEVVSGETISLDEIIRMVDETQQVIEYSQALESKSRELEETTQQLRAANERLLKLDSEKDDFLSQVSHELRTPMTSIRSFAELLTSPEELSAGQAERFVGIIHGESLRLTRLLDDILDLSRLERGQTDWKVQPVNPEESVTRAINACEGLATMAGVTVERKPCPLDVEINGNLDRIDQILINLLSNAIKYNDGTEPTVWISANVSDGYYQITVADNGPGLGDFPHDKLFRKFSRGWRLDEKSPSGSGLGLAISAEIARNLGGRLELVRSDSSGSSFCLSLPVLNWLAARSA